MASEQVVFERVYGAKLAELTFNSKPIINTLTMLADEHRTMADSVAELIAGSILQVSNFSEFFHNSIFSQFFTIFKPNRTVYGI